MKDEIMYDKSGKRIGTIANGNLVWTCNPQTRTCTWENNPTGIISAANKKKRCPKDKISVTQMLGGNR